MSTKSNMLVSVITLTYRKFDKLYDTIRSALNQDYCNIEYIICDDGSEMFPKAEIEAFIKENNDSNIKVVVLDNKQNVGTVKNMNRAYRMASGECYINLSCGDVFFGKNTVSRIVDAFETGSCDVLVTSRLQYRNDFEPIKLMPHYNDRKKIEKWNTPLKQYEAFISSSFRNMASGSAMYFRRSLMEKMGFFDENYLLWEDGPFLEKFLWNNKLHMRYDIVSIWYEDGGVSSGKLHPLLEKDVIHYNETDRLKHIDEIDKAVAKRVYYRISSQNARSFTERLGLKITHMPEFVHFLADYICDRIYTKRDQAVIRDIIAKKII